MPAPLPSITLTGYGFDIEPSGTQLAAPATLHITNWRNAPTAQPIPAGTFDAVNGGWQHVAMASWDGKAWTYSIQHFSTHDLNPDDFGEWVLLSGHGQDPNGGSQICGGSSLSVSGGSVSQTVALPTYRHGGRDYGVTLNYNSGLAGSRTLGTGPSGSAQAVPSAGVAVSVRSQTFSKMCAAQEAAASLIAANPGSCGLGSCNLGATLTVTPWNIGINWMGLQQSQTINYPPNASSMDVGTWVDLPLGQDGSTTTGSGFVTQQITAALQTGSSSASSPACVVAGAFGSPNFGQVTPSNLQPGPALSVQRQVLVYHRHNSPFGAGWAIEELPRLYVPPGSSDYATLVRGDGSEEDFKPRARIATQVPTSGDSDLVFAVDAATGDNLMVNDHGTIVRLNGDGTSTSVVSGLSFDGAVQSLAVTYINGQRNYLVALTTRLLWVQPGGTVQSIYTRGGNMLGTYVPAQVAARNDLAVYTEGNVNQPLLYRIRLSSAPGVPETISSPKGSGDPSLNPTGTAVANYQFYEPAGLAYAATGELYVADSARHAVMKLSVDANGEIGPTSVVKHVVGDGAGRWVPDLGESFPALQFPINQPYYVSTAPDGTLLLASNYGVAAYDPVSTQAQWIVFDHNTPSSDLSYTLFSNFTLNQVGPYTNIAATGPRSFLVAPAVGPAFPSLFDASQLGSDLDPTRSVTFSNGTATLVDTTRALVETYDAQGRLTQRSLRTGEPILGVAYADDRSDRVSALIDPDGNQTVFNYDSGTQKLSSIRDPAGRVTQFGRNGFGDLTSLTEPDGEVITFQYDGHHMTSKTARGTDTTTYAYNPDGTLHSATKPAGETTTLTASLSTGPQYATTGALVTSGSYTDAHGVTHSFVTDSRGQLQTDNYTADGVAYSRALVYATQLDATPSEFATSSNANLLRVAYTTLNGVPLGRIQHYDSLGRVDVEDGQAARDRIYQYDTSGWLADVLIAPSDVDQRIVRDAAGHPLRIFDESHGNPTGREVDFAWGRSDGQPSSIVQHGVTFALSYDDSSSAPTRNVSGMVDTLGRTATFGYDASGNVAVASDGTTTNSFAYDGNNRLIVAADALGNQTTLGYTQVTCGCTETDEVTSIHTPDLAAGAQWTLGYGPEGRLAAATDPDGLAESYGYEPTGELNALTDRNGNITSIAHDHLGRILNVVDALGRAHARTYTVPQSGAWSGPTLSTGSVSGAPASTDFTAALNPGDYQIGRNLYQTLGYPAQVSFYRDATFQLAYVDQWDENRRLTSHRDRAAEPISSSDVLNLTSNFTEQDILYSTSTSASVVTSVSSPSPPSALDSASFDYNAQFDLLDNTGYGRLGNEVTYTYDRDTGGRLTGVHRTWRAIDGSFFTGPNQTYSYLPNGKLQTYTGPDGTKSFTYDARGLLQTMSVTLGSSVEHWSFDYDPVGRSAHVVYPDGHVREQLYTPEGRIRSRCYQYGSTSYCYTATYDGAGNPLTMTDPYGGEDDYQYDALNRLTQGTHKVNGATEHVETYSYNAIGAVKTSFDPTTMSTVTLDDQRPNLSGGGTAPAAVPNSIGGQPITLDGGGRITTLLGVTFTYDFRNRVTGTQYTSGGNTVTETYGYDSFLRRVQRVHVETNPATSTSEFYVFDGASVVASVGQGGALKDAYLFGGTDHPLRLMRSGNGYFYEIDLGGNVRRLRDSSGADLGGYRYTAFGALLGADPQTPTPTVDQPLRWKGRLFEKVAGGVYDMRARWWAPQAGIFLAPDDYAFHDPSSTLWGWPGQSPSRWQDASGHYAAPAPLAVAVANPWGLAVADVAIWGLVAYEAYGLYRDLTTPTVFSCSVSGGGNIGGGSPPPPVTDAPPPDSPDAGRTKPYYNRHGQLTNGKYTIDESGMDPHQTGSLADGKSQWLSSVDAEQAVLDAADVADENGLWDAQGKAKVQANGYIGALGRTGELTDWINVYRTSTGFIHGSPGSPPAP
jgi:RHS repeat-associated protein